MKTFVKITFAITGTISSLALFVQLTSATDQPAWSPVNLTKYYNSSLTNSVLNKATETLNNSLSPLPRGRQNHAGVPFEVQGIIQLGGRLLENDGWNFPQKVEGIEINQTFDRIQLLHAVGYHIVVLNSNRSGHGFWKRLGWEHRDSLRLYSKGL